MMNTLGEYGRWRMRAHGRRSPSGFSLVELMLVIAIIMLLAAMSIPRLLDAQKKAYEAGVVTFLRTVQSNQESYRLANGSYSDNFTDLGILARAPAAPGDIFAQDQWARLLSPIAQLVSSTVLAAQGAQQPPAKTPPPAPGEPGFGGTNPAKRPKRVEGGAGAPNVGGGGGSGGGPAKGGAGAGGTGPGRNRKGAGGGTSLGGTPAGGGTGSPGSGGSTTPQTGGAGGAFPPSTSSTKTNILLKHNYIFTLQRPSLTTWNCTAAPVRDRGESKFFYFDQTGVIRVELGKFAGSTSPQL